MFLLEEKSNYFVLIVICHEGRSTREEKVEDTGKWIVQLWSEVLTRQMGGGIQSTGVPTYFPWMEEHLIMSYRTDNKDWCVFGYY